MFNMPRAAINFNDGLGGGNLVEKNLIWNTCRCVGRSVDRSVDSLVRWVGWHASAFTGRQNYSMAVNNIAWFCFGSQFLFYLCSHRMYMRTVRRFLCCVLLRMCGTYAPHGAVRHTHSYFVFVFAFVFCFLFLFYLGFEFFLFL